LLIGANVLVFAAMLLGGAGLWHSPNGIQLAWGANFAPATQDGEWWRLGSAMFLHFGLLHLAFNMWALWDGGQWVERMYGRYYFLLIYFLSGLLGNLLSLVVHTEAAVSGGASGAIFGIYGALLSYLWLMRRNILPGEFRWLFWGAIGFSGITIVFGFLVQGIDNAAHIGGLLTGMLAGVLLVREQVPEMPAINRYKIVAGLFLVLSVGIMINRIPPQKYSWNEEKRARQEIGDFLREDAAISLAWDRILNQSRGGRVSFDELAEQIDTVVTQSYGRSFEELSSLPSDAEMPSTPTIEKLRRYAERRRDASHALAEGLRTRDRARIKGALEQARKSTEGE